MLLMRTDLSPSLYNYNNPQQPFQIPRVPLLLLHGSQSSGGVLGLPSMTMVPVGNPFHGGGSCGLVSRVEAAAYSNNSCNNNNLLSSDHNRPIIIMAEEESRTTGSLNDAAASSSRENNNKNPEQEDEEEKGWLQLSIGNNSQGTKYEIHDDQQQQKSSAAALSSSSPGGGLVELDLLPPGVTRPAPQQPPTTAVVPTAAAVQNSVMMNIAANYTTSPYSFFQVNHPHAPPLLPYSSHHHHSSSQDLQWAFRFPPSSTNSLSSPSSSSPSSAALMPMIGSCFGRPVAVQMAGVAADLGGSSYSDNVVRVVNAPRRPHSGIWFMLQASKSQAREPFLPQIPKSFLRIKDGGMTVRLVMKYLVNKLRLNNESEIEIRCRGQQLVPYLTLQHVRDNIWSQRDDENAFSSPSISTVDHLMVLHYARSTPPSSAS